MKILYIHNTTIDSEKANLIQVLSMCNAFVANEIEIDLALPVPNVDIGDRNDYFYNRFGIELKFNLIFYEPSYNYSKLEKYFGYNSIKKILASNNAEYVFLRIPKFVRLVLKAGKKVIFESHNNIMHNKISIIDKYWKRSVLKYVKRSNFVLFISISQNLSNYWENLGVPSSKLIALHDGFSVKQYKTKADKKAVRIKLGIPLDVKIAMYVGSLYPDREIDNILLLAKRTPNVLFYVVGGPKLFKKHYIAKTVEMELRNVKFIGYVPHSDVPDYLFAADILLALWSSRVPTINYCSPLKIFEYMASGQTIIAHKFKTIEEVLDDKIDALLVRPDDQEHLFETLKNAINKPNNKLGKSARKKVFKLYTWQYRANQIVKRLSYAHN